MKRIRRTWLLPVVPVLLSVLGVPVEPPVTAQAGAAEEPDDLGPPDVLPPEGSWSVTLLTGHVVDVASDSEGRVRAKVRDGSSSVRSMRLPTGDVYVVPIAVSGLLDEVLDHELFNVTDLIRQGYDDARSDVIPLIVQPDPAAHVDVQSTLATTGARPLPSIGAVAVEVPKATGEPSVFGADAAGLAQFDGFRHVWLDGKVTAPPVPETSASGDAVALDPNLTQIGADRAWAAGYDGDGVRVGVLDTGIDLTHPDVDGQVVAVENFARYATDTVDRHGHGTHVASTVAGTGAAAAGTRTGVAPAADLVIGKVLDDHGVGLDSDIVAGMEWAAAQTDVINMSLGGGIDTDGSDPLSLAVDQLSDQYGTLFVISAGNSGPESSSIGSPGASDRALTVGAVDFADQLTEWSSRGPLDFSFEMKPEVVAPGQDVVAARAANTAMGRPVSDRYTAASGTSMAAPHVAGAAALLAQQHPDWSPMQLKNHLVGSADPVPGDGHAVGGGRLDVGDAVARTLRSEQDVVDVALPHPREAEHVQTVSWTNTGDQPVTVELTGELLDRDGAAVDALDIEPAALTLAPGAIGSATLRIDAPALDAGLYSGTVTATAPDGTAVRTPVGVHAEARQVDLTIQANDLPGTSGDQFLFYAVVNLDDWGEFFSWDALRGKTVTLQVPAGRYAVVGDVSTLDNLNTVTAQVGDPDIELGDDTTVLFDAAAAVPLSPTVEGVTTGPPVNVTTWVVSTPRHGTGGRSFDFYNYSEYPQSPVMVTPMEGDPAVFTSRQLFRLQAPHITAEVGDEAVPVMTVPHVRQPLGTQTLTAVFAGNGDDLSGAAGALAVVRRPLFDEQVAAISQRAVDADVAVLAFVDERRPYLTKRWLSPAPADVPIVMAGGPAATRLITAGQAGEAVTVAGQPSPYVYDIVRTEPGQVDPAPVVDQSPLARVDESFHHDGDTIRPTGDARGPLTISLIDGMWSAGPLPERRTSYLSPDIVWQSQVQADALEKQYGSVYLIRGREVSSDGGKLYAPASRSSLTWLARPQWPGFVSEPLPHYWCQPESPIRTADTMWVYMMPMQDGRDRISCVNPPESRLTLERDGTTIGTVDRFYAGFPVPAERGTYRLSYEQVAQAPYPHRSSTTWTFRSAAPDGEAPLPVLEIGYRLPLDLSNRLTGRTARLSIGRVSGAPTLVLPPRVSTSTDGGATWQHAPVRWRWFGSFQVTLPEVPAGTAVSLQVDARDLAGSRVEQTLIDAYVG